MRNKRFLVCAWLVLVAAIVPALGADAPEAPLALEIDKADLNAAVRGTLAEAVAFIRARAAKDEDGWVIPPIRTRKVTGYEEVTVRYARKTFREPVYEYETYETYEREMGDDSLSSKRLKKVTRRRIKRQIGTRPVERLVSDPKGPIIRKVKRAIWGGGGPDFWGVGRLGHNALALVALRRAGVSHDDEMVSRLAENLADFVEHYGAPDFTWDLACMTAAFALLPDGFYQKLAESMAGKLLDGQIPGGTCKGLWGPVSINTQLLAAALKYEQILSKIREREKARLEQRETPLVRKKFDKAEAALHALQQDIVHIAMSASALEKIDYRIYLTPEGQDPITLIGLPHYVFTQTTADVESTAVALWALRIAAERGVLPKQTVPPSVGGRPLLPAKRTGSVLSRAARALAAAQQKNGGWNEMNQHQPVKDFNRMTGFPGIPVRQSRFAALDSPATALSAWQGCAGLLAAGHAIGLDRLLAQLRPIAERGLARTRRLAEALAKGTLEDAALGARVPPYDGYLFLAGVSREFQGAKEDRRDLWRQLAFKLVDAQNDDGSWGKRYPVGYFLPTSLRARLQSKDPVLRRTPESPDRSRAHSLLTLTEKGEPAWKYVSYGRRSPLHRRKQPARTGHYAFDRVVHATACAMLFLADGVRPPVAGECVWSDKAGAAGLLGDALALMRTRCNAAFAYAPIAAGLPTADLLPLPALVLRGTGPLKLSDPARKALQGYLGQGGLVLVTAAADPAGSTFLKEAEAALRGLVTDAKDADIGADQARLGEMAGKVAVRAITGAKGAPVVVLLPVAARAAKGALTAPQAAAVAAELLLRRVPADLLKESYPAGLDEPDDVGKEGDKPQAPTAPAKDGGA